MEISLRNRVLVGLAATAIIVGSGVATALVTSGDGPNVAAADTSTSTGDSVDTTTPSTPDATTPASPGVADDEDSESDGTGEAVARYWDPLECGSDEPMNHGQYVSSQPKGGEARSTAAQSDCGKPIASVGDASDAPDDESGDESGDGANVSQNPSSASGGQGASNGKAYGRNK